VVGNALERREMLAGFLCKTWSNTLLGGPCHKWQDNIKMDFRGRGWEVVWIYLVQDRDRWHALLLVFLLLL
jgi:hypothetical protein